MSKFFGIPGKTALIFIVVFILIILPVNFIIYKNVKRILIEADTQELKAEGERLFNQVRIDPQILPLPSLGYSMFLRMTNGIESDSVFASPGFPTDLLSPQFTPVEELDTLKIITLTRTLPYSNAELIFSLARSNERLTSQLLELRYYLFAANIISIFVAGVLVFFVTWYTLSPIRKIIAVAQNINASKSIERVPVPKSMDENRQLAITINEMLSRIESSIQHQTNFFASAAHELRTPLTVMKAELTLVSGEHRWHDMLKEVERLERTVNDFLMISQLKSESLTIRKKEMDVQELLFSALKKVKYFQGERKAQLKIELKAEELGSIDADEDKLEIVLVNLLVNAIKYSPEHSSIKINLSRASMVVIEIQNPIHQPIEDAERFKKDFVKAEAMSSGLGMGLWIADEIIKLHQATLQLKSEGLSFTAIIFLPAGK